jgi:hypothetical protein
VAVENDVQDSVTDLVGSAMGAPVDSSALASRRALVKNTSEKAVLNSKRGACMECD